MFTPFDIFAIFMPCRYAMRYTYAIMPAITLLTRYAFRHCRYQDVLRHYATIIAAAMLAVSADKRLRCRLRRACL